jgi:hypothetical protein
MFKGVYQENTEKDTVIKIINMDQIQRIETLSQLLDGGTVLPDDVSALSTGNPENYNSFSSRNLMMEKSNKLKCPEGPGGVWNPRSGF